MSKRTANSLFIVSSIPRLYQQLLNGAVSYEALGNHIIEYIKSAHAFRQIETVKQLSGLLIGIPIKEYQLIGQYYLIWCQSRNGEYHNHLLENIIEHSKTYKTKALISRAAFEVHQGNTNNALYFYNEAFKTPFTLSEYIEASRGVAMVKSLEGFSQSALTDLERLTPIIRHAEPAVYHSVLNSCAVELGEVGRIEEAINISRVVLATPFAFAYPEWRETGQDLTLRGYKSRSSVPIIRKIPVVRRVPGNVLYMSERERSEGHRRSPFDLPRGVSILAEWKKKMVKENGENDEKNLDEMSEKDLFMELMRVASNESLTYKKLRKMVDAVKKIAESKD